MSADLADRVGERLRAGPPPWRRLWVRVVVAYLALRLVSWLLLAQAADQQVWFPGITGPSEGHVDLALSWDAQWYQRIAADGYPRDLPVSPDGEVQQNPWAFYPVFPYACRLVGTLTGLDFATVAPLLALLAGAGAAVLMALLLRETLPHAGDGPILGIVAVWAALPVAPVLQLAYTESFSMVLLLAFLLLVVRRHWWAASAAALLLGLTRPIALPLCVVVAVALLMRWRERDARPIDTREQVGLAALVVGTGLSGVLWTAIAWLGTGQRDAYPTTMAAWRGDHAINVLEPWQRTLTWALEYHDKVFVLPVLAITGAGLMAVAMLVPRFAPAVDWRLKAWALAYALYLLAVVDGHTSIFRYLIALFPLAIVLVGAHRQRVLPWWQVRTTFWVVAGIVGQVGWIWWLLLFSPPSDYPP